MGSKMGSKFFQIVTPQPVHVGRGEPPEKILPHSCDAPISGSVACLVVHTTLRTEKPRMSADSSPRSRPKRQASLCPARLATEGPSVSEAVWPPGLAYLVGWENWPELSRKVHGYPRSENSAARADQQVLRRPILNEEINSRIYAAFATADQVQADLLPGFGGN